MSHQIKVLNKNKDEIVDYFDGIAYKFKTDVAVNVPFEAAKHIFGVEFPADVEECKSDEFRATVYHNLQKRWGWNSYDPAKAEKSRALFDNLTFTPIVFKLIEAEPDREELADPRKLGGKFTKKAKPEAENVA